MARPRAVAVVAVAALAGRSVAAATVPVPTGADASRRLGAIVGAAVADAAAMPLHWIYNTSSIDSKLKGGKDPAFFSPPSFTFYHYPEGENTPYGQQNRVYIQALAASPPGASPHGLNASAMQDAYYAYYGPEGAPCHVKQGPPLRITGCYWDDSTKGFVSNYDKGKRWPDVGADDTQANAIAHMVPMVASLAGQSGFLVEVEKLIRVTQNTRKAVAFGLAAARVLERVVLGQAPLDAVRAAAVQLRDPERPTPQPEDSDLAAGLEMVLGQLHRPHREVVKEIGQSCAYPFNLLTGAHIVAQVGREGMNGTAAFLNATRETILAGGDSGSRGTFVGAVLGAAAGEEGIPAAWKAKYLHYDEVFGNAKRLLNLPPGGLDASPRVILM